MTCLLCPKLRPKIPGVLPEKFGGGVRHAPKTLTLFRSQICDFPYPISDLIKNLIPFRPEAQEPSASPERVTSCYGTYPVAGVNIKREMVFRLMMKKQLIVLKNIPNSRLECTNHVLFQTKMVEIDTLFKVSVKENEVPTEKISSRASVFATKASYISN